MLIFELESRLSLEVAMAHGWPPRARRCARLGRSGLSGNYGAHGRGDCGGEAKDSGEGEAVRAREIVVCGGGQRGEGGGSQGRVRRRRRVARVSTGVGP